MENKENKLQLNNIFSKNLILFLIVQLFYDFNNNMASAFFNMGAKAVGISAASIGLAASVYSIGAWLVRMPAGSLTSIDKKKMVLVGAITFRTICIIILGTVGMTNGTTFVLAKGLYGLAWGITGVLVPATAAMLIDKRVMGTTFAVYTAVAQLSKNMIKALGVYVYKNHGATTAVLAASGFALVAIILLQFMDFNDEKFLAARPTKKKKGILASLNVKFIPICLLLSLASFAYNMQANYTNVLAQDRGLDIASVLAICSVVGSISAFVLSAACDIISPTIVLGLVYTFLAVGMVLTGRATTYNSLLIGQVIAQIGLNFPKLISVFLFKNCTQQEKGSVQATNFFCTDTYSVIAGVLLGSLVEFMGYEFSYNFCAVTAIASAVLVIFAGKRMMKAASSAAETA